LEEKGIGRPSTFASLLDKIMERGYVKKEDVKGKKINCIDFELTDDTIEEKTHEKEFGNEKNRLVIQPVGLLVIEFLIENFQQLLKYGR
jgi:DNA topoisomerase-1